MVIASSLSTPPLCVTFSAACVWRAVLCLALGWLNLCWLWPVGVVGMLCPSCTVSVPSRPVLPHDTRAGGDMGPTARLLSAACRERVCTVTEGFLAQGRDVFRPNDSLSRHRTKYSYKL